MRLQKWLEIKDLPDEENLVDDIKDRVLFELSFIDKTALSEQDTSKLFHAYMLYFLKKDSEKGESVAYISNRYYRANSKEEAYGAFCKHLEEKDITPETVSCKWRPEIREIDPECFIDVRGD